MTTVVCANQKPAFRLGPITTIISSCLGWVRDSTFERIFFVPSEGLPRATGQPAVEHVARRCDAWQPSLASAAMTAADDATLKDGDLNQRAMPNLDQGDVDALAAAVAPMLAEDDALRAWCSASPAIVRRRASVGTLLRRSS